MLRTTGSWWDCLFGTFIFATLAKFIFVVDSSLIIPDWFDDSLVLVRTSTIDVVKIFEANGLYSPVIVVVVEDGAATNNDDDDVGGIWWEVERDDLFGDIWFVSDDDDDGWWLFG